MAMNFLQLANGTKICELCTRFHVKKGHLFSYHTLALLFLSVNVKQQGCTLK